MKEINYTLRNYNIGEPSIISNLMILPVFGKSFDNGNTIVLDEAQSAGAIQVEELHIPQVGQVNIKNFTDSNFFGLEGEELLGALQHRIFVTSFLLPGRTEKVVPVSCVEEGRWSGNKNFLSGSTIAYPTLRAITSTSLLQNLSRGRGFEVDQQSIWKEISRKQTTLKTHSNTRSMHDTFEQLSDEISHFSNYTPEKDQVGFLALTNKKILCADIFLNPELFKKFMKKLLISYAIDALEDSSAPGSFNLKMGEKFFSSLISVKRFKKFAGIGLGNEWRFKEKGILGKALVYQEKIFHLSAFPFSFKKE